MNPNSSFPAAQTISRKVLVADDNADNAESLSMLLRMLGHAVVLACDGVEALENAQREKPDVAILDIGMPGINGYDLARAIRREEWGPGAFLIAATGWGQEDDKTKAAAAGFDAHLTKPLDLDALERLIAGSAPAPGTRRDAEVNA